MSLKKLSGNQQLSHPMSSSMASSSSPGPKAWRETSAIRTPQSRLQHPHHQTLPLFAYPEPGSPSPPADLAQIPCLHRREGYCCLGLGGRAFGEAQWRPRQAHLRGVAPQDAWRLMAKLLLTAPSPSSFCLAYQLWESHFSEYHPFFLMQLPCRSATGSLSSTQKHSMV